MKRTRSMYLALVAVLLSPMAANADLIEISGTGSSDGVWEIILIESAFEDIQDILEAQEWWDDGRLARMFAEELGPLPGFDQFGLSIGPLFLYSSGGSGRFAAYGDPAGDAPYDLYTWCCGGGQGDSRTFTYATARSVPEPGTLALLGIGLLGMAAARRRRKV